MRIDLSFLNEMKSTNTDRLNAAFETLVETSNSSVEWFDLMSEYKDLEHSNELIDNLYGVYEAVDKYGFTKSIETLVGEQLKAVGINFSVEADTTNEVKPDNGEAKRSFLGKVIDAIVEFFKKIGRFFAKIWNWIFGKKQDDVIKAVEQKVTETTKIAKETNVKEIKDEDIELPPNASFFFGNKNDNDKAMIVNLAAIASAELKKIAKCDTLSSLATPGKDPYEGIDFEEPKEPEVKKLAEKVGNLTANEYSRKFGKDAVIKIASVYTTPKKITIKSKTFVSDVGSGFFAGVMDGIRELSGAQKEFQKTDLPNKINKTNEEIEKVAEIVKNNPKAESIKIGSKMIPTGDLLTSLKSSKAYANNLIKTGQEVVKIRNTENEILKAVSNTLDVMNIVLKTSSENNQVGDQTEA